MERLDLRLVEYFVATAEELHFGRAATKLHIAQPSLSQQVRELESRLGVTLLERDSRNVRLTEAGELMLREGRQLLRRTDKVVRDVRAQHEQLDVGFFGSAANRVLPETLRVLGRKTPRVGVAVRELPLGSIDAVVDGTVDLAFCRLRPAQSELETTLLCEEPRVLCVSKTHALANAGTVQFGDLRGESFIVNPARRDEPTPMRWLNEQRRHGLPGRIGARAGSLPEILNLIAAERGVCFLPEVVRLESPRQDLAWVQVDDAEPAVVSIVRKPGSPSAATQAFFCAALQTARSQLGGSTSAASPSL